MSHLQHLRTLLFVLAFMAGTAAMAQTTKSKDQEKPKNETTMKTYLIERDIPGASKLTPEQLKGISQTSCSVLKEMGPQIQWMQSYVAGDKVFCVYKAENENLLREHAKKGGFPITSITEVANTISPATAQ